MKEVKEDVKDAKVKDEAKERGEGYKEGERREKRG